MKKRILMILAVCVMLVCLTGCGDRKSRFKLGEYKGLSYKNEEITVSEEDLTALLNSLQNSYVKYEVDESRAEKAIRKGDIVNIDYTGVLEGQTEPFEGGTTKGAHLEIGSGNYIPGFEDGLVGKKVGDTVELKLTFPEQYYTDFAGKNVTFTVKINAIENKIVPELNDALIEDYTEGKIKTIREYKDYAREYLLAQKQANFNTQVKNELLSKIVSTTTFDKMDQQRIDSAYEDLLKYYTSMASQSGLSLEDFVVKSGYSKSLQEFYAEMKASAEETVKEEIVLNEIVAKEKITLTDETYNSLIDAYMSRYGYTERDKFEQDYTKDRIRRSMLFDMALKFILDNAKAE